MPRPNRLNLPDIPQHVTQRGNNRQPSFFSDSDYQLYLDLLHKCCIRHDCELHAYALMTNHVHLLVTPRIADGVSLLFRDLGRDYVRQINKKYDRCGSLWQGRFKSSLVDSDSYCLACYRYIELNPVRAGMVRKPQDYQWSSFAGNALGLRDPLITPHETWLSLAATQNDRQRAYKELFHTALNQQTVDEIRLAQSKGLPTGTSAFKRRVEEALGITLGARTRGRPKKAAG